MHCVHKGKCTLNACYLFIIIYFVIIIIFAVGHKRMPEEAGGTADGPDVPMPGTAHATAAGKGIVIRTLIRN